MSHYNLIQKNPL